MKSRTLIYIALLLTGSSCQKEDVAVVLPPPGDMTKVVANIDPDYGKQVYVSLANNSQVTRNLKDWDLAFEASADGYRVYLNTGKNMFACRTEATSLLTADTIGKNWYVDNTHLDDDSTAIGNWFVNNQSTNEVMIIDRGKIYYNGATANQRLKKISLQSVTAASYVFTFSDYNNTNIQNFTLPKDLNYSLMYFSFDNNGRAVDIAPPKDEWDIVFTRYTYTFYDEPVGSIYKYYLVTGGLANRWNGITGVKLVKDSIAGYLPFDQLKSSNASTFPFKTDADAVGYDWKALDNSLNFVVLPNRYYILKDKNGFYYKIRFIDFYDENGEKGYITFDYQRL